MNYKLIAMDLDGTLTNSEKKISKRTYEVLMEAQERGIRLALASGRTDIGVSRLADELKLDAYGGFVLSFNGARIIDWRTRQALRAIPVPEKRLGAIYAVSREYDLPLLAHEGDHLIVEQPDHPYIILEAKINQMPIKKIDSYAEYVRFPIYKFIAVGEGERLARLEPLVQKRLEPECEVYRSTPFFLEIVGAGANKGEAVSFLAEHLGISLGQVIAFGDGYNDITMLSAAGLGVAMENAEKEVKEAADCVTASNDEDGIALLLEEVWEK